MSEISNTQDIIDSREVIDRITELESALEDVYAGEDGKIDDFEEWLQTITDAEHEDHEFRAEADELIILRNLAEECSCCPDWEYGVGLIHEDYFVKYCEELCQEIGDVPKDLPWYIESNIDWYGVAEAIKADYMEDII